ncbi:hypothetical protein GCM10023259_103750 [Thermocatellispora tengchongensis]|uniref:Uncharacterized protein n=1 Tax=Arthrobacter ginkgonis TaxID=1630594 RepID=A0ABP7DKM0_9MICC
MTTTIEARRLSGVDLGKTVELHHERSGRLWARGELIGLEHNEYGVLLRFPWTENKFRVGLHRLISITGKPSPGAGATAAVTGPPGPEPRIEG